MTNLNELLLFTIIGRVFIYLWMEFPLPQCASFKFIEQLHGCDLCGGVYVFAILSGLLHVDLIQMLGIIGYPVINQILTGGIISFLVHLVRIGWDEKFNGGILEQDGL